MPQTTLMTFQPAPRKTAFQFLDDLAVAPDRSVEALQVAVDDPGQIVEAVAAGQRDGAKRLRLVAFAVAQKAQTRLSVCRRSDGSRGTSGTEHGRSS